MPLPYSKAVAFIGVVSGEENCLVLPAPPRGTLVRLIVKQTEGALEGFEFDLYDREDACPGISQESCNPGDEAFDPDLHKIAPTVVVAAAGAYYENFAQLTPYENKDSLCDGVHAAKRSQIYLAMEPAGSGDKVFEVAITVTTDLT